MTKFDRLPPFTDMVALALHKKEDTDHENAKVDCAYFSGIFADVFGVSINISSFFGFLRPFVRNRDREIAPTKEGFRFASSLFS